MITTGLFIIILATGVLAFAVRNAFLSLNHVYRVIDTQDLRIQRLERAVFGPTPE